MSSTTLASQAIRTTGVITEVAFVVFGVALLATLAQVVIPLPFTPVPVTGQTLAALLIGAGYGATRGLLTLCAYVVVGALGMPVFADQTGGLDILAAPSAGYLFGMVVAAGVVGSLAERGWERRITSALAAMVLGNAIIYAFGVAWLAMILHVGLGKATVLGVVPFIPGDAIKVAVAAGLLPATWKLVERIRGKNP